MKNLVGLHAIIMVSNLTQISNCDIFKIVILDQLNGYINKNFETLRVTGKGLGCFQLRKSNVLFSAISLTPLCFWTFQIKEKKGLLEKRTNGQHLN